MTDEQKSHLTLYLLGAIVTAVKLAFVSPNLVEKSFVT